MKILSASSCFLLTAVVFCASVPGVAQQAIADLVQEYDQYVVSDSWKVDRGTLRVRKFNAVATSIVIETGPTGQSKVTLTMPDVPGKKTIIDMKRFYLERKQSTIYTKHESVELSVPEDGSAWFLVLHPLQHVDLLNYKPTPVLKVPQIEVLRAKYPVVDMHADLPKDPKTTAEGRLEIMDAVGLAIAVNGTKIARADSEKSYLMFEAKAPNRFVTFAPVNFRLWPDPEFSEKVVAQLESDVERFGVCGIAEMVDKGPGISEVPFFPRPGYGIPFDDEVLWPLWQAAVRLHLPILLHVADPAGNYQDPAAAEDPIPSAVAPQYNVYGLPVPSAEEMRQRRDRLLERFPDLIVISNHMDNCSHDLETLGKRLRKYPNLYVEIGVRYPELARQPRTARAFLIEFQDRVLYGGDSLQTIEDYRLQFRIFETEDDAITRPFERNSIWPSYGLGLPDVVLKKLYYANAAKLIPTVKERLLAMYPDLDFPG